MKILLLNGPNLRLLGTREPGIYGSATLSMIVSSVEQLAAELGCRLEHFQSDIEGELVGRIGRSLGSDVDGLLINAGAYTHTSIAIRDAISATSLPAVEIHLSNVAKREAFRHVSMIAPVCLGVVAGFGSDSYLLALRALVAHLGKRCQK